MSRAYSISMRRPFGMARVCRVWSVPRATVYRHRIPVDGFTAANAQRPPQPMRNAHRSGEDQRGPAVACLTSER